MVRAIERFVVFILLCTLSLQGLAAIAMPFCQHQPMNHLTMSDQGDAAHQVQGASPKQGASPDSQRQHEKASTNLACDDCDYCQLCAAPALSATIAIAPLDLAPAFNPQPPSHFFLFVPEQTQRPPLPLI